MKLSTPEDDPGNSIDQTEDGGEEEPSLPMIETEMTDRLETGAVSIDTAVSMNGNMLEMALESLAALERENEELREELREVREIQDVMITRADYGTGECADCGGDLVDENPIYCSDCGKVPDVLE